jgi:hypothetical protein
MSNFLTFRFPLQPFPMNPNPLRRVRSWANLLILGPLALLASCEKTDDGVLDPPAAKPFVMAASVSPENVFTISLPQSGSGVLASLTVKATVSSPAGSPGILSVTAEFVDPSSGIALTKVDLAKDQSVVDTAAGVIHYAGTLTVTLPKSTAGRYNVKVSLTTEYSTGANTVQKTVTFFRTNHPPVLTNLVMPDTVDVPSGTNSNFKASVTVTDQDGESDIKQVFFVNLDSSDPAFRYLLRDDGSVGTNSGDAAAGDGIYTITVAAPFTAKGRSFRFSFQANDTFGDTSASIIHFVTIR